MEWTALAGLGAAAALCALVVKQRSPELAVLVSLAACAVLLTRTLPLFETVRDRMEALADQAGLAPAVLAPIRFRHSAPAMPRLPAMMKVFPYVPL